MSQCFAHFSILNIIIYLAQMLTTYLYVSRTAVTMNNRHNLNNL